MGVDCQAGACRTWVDDELDAMGEAGAHIPRPGGCCEEDVKKQKEAARMLGELREVDRSTARMRIAEGVVGECGEEDADDEDWARSDGDDDDDEALREIQEARLRELKGAAAIVAAEARRARYVEIKESALGETVRASSRVVAHLVLEGAEQCARIDEVCDDLAPVFAKTKFVRIRPSHDSALMRQHRISALPAMLIFRRGRLTFTTCALDDFGGAENFEEERVTRWLAKHDALPGHPFAENSVTNVDSDASSDEENDDASDEELFGVNKPCETCGRTYPHKHIRALRPGESMRRADDSDGDYDDDDF
tara:strand:+ start:87 stop:1010 length:924 start_codon:yes stop_codon:yes gene_type:complete